MAKNLINDETFEFEEGAEKTELSELAGTVESQSESITAQDTRLTTAENKLSALDGELTVAFNVWKLEGTGSGGDYYELTEGNWNRMFEVDRDGEPRHRLNFNKNEYASLIIEFLYETLQYTGSGVTNALEIHFLDEDGINASSNKISIKPTQVNEASIRYMPCHVVAHVNLLTGTYTLTGSAYVNGTQVNLSESETPASADIPDIIGGLRIKVKANENDPLNTRGLSIRVTGARKTGGT